jgi:hypothetical protein
LQQFLSFDKACEVCEGERSVTLKNMREINGQSEHGNPCIHFPFNHPGVTSISAVSRNHRAQQRDDNPISNRLCPSALAFGVFGKLTGKSHGQGHSTHCRPERLSALTWSYLAMDQRTLPAVVKLEEGRGRHRSPRGRGVLSASTIS